MKEIQTKDSVYLKEQLSDKYLTVRYLFFIHRFIGRLFAELLQRAKRATENDIEHVHPFPYQKANAMTETLRNGCY